MDDFKPPVKNDKPETPTNGPVHDSAPTFQERETYVTPQGQPTSTLAIPPKKSSAKKWLLGGVIVLILAGTGALAYWQYTEAENVKRELSSVTDQLKTVKDSNAAADAAGTELTQLPETEDFSAFLQQYNAIQAAAVTPTDADKTAIEKAVKDYYKLTTLPTGWAILAVYKDAKADEATGKPLNALIYWPASAEKPAGFFEMNQAENGTWMYSDLR